MAISRNFGLKEYKDSKSVRMMVPLADMLNTGWEHNTRWSFSSSRDGFVIDALRDIAAGEQLLDTYGHKTNAEYFMNYGFILLDDKGHND